MAVCHRRSARPCVVRAASRAVTTSTARRNARRASALTLTEQPATGRPCHRSAYLEMQYACPAVPTHMQPVPVGARRIFLGGIQVGIGYRSARNSTVNSARVRRWRPAGNTAPPATSRPPSLTARFELARRPTSSGCGFRIEPGGDRSGDRGAARRVRQAVVMIRQLAGLRQPPATQLLCDGHRPTDAAALRCGFKSKLPDYMVPISTVVLDAPAHAER